ncbi:response regulator [bacterium]|nr:response regulator [bacterium]
MSFEKSFERTRTLTLSSKERQAITILIVEPEASLRQNLRQSLLGLGYGGVSDASDHAQALQKIEDRNFTHLIFDAKISKISPLEFITRALDLDPKMTALASSYEPTVDDVFDLLIAGAKGYLVKPLTAEALDETIVMSTKGEPISDAVLNAKNRNEALAALVLSALDNLATILRQSQHFQTAKREIPQKSIAFRRAIDLGRTFAKGGPMMLREALIELSLARGEGPATRLGRFRKRQEMRKKAKEKANLQTSQEEEETTIEELDFEESPETEKEEILEPTPDP